MEVFIWCLTELGLSAGGYTAFAEVTSAAGPISYFKDTAGEISRWVPLMDFQHHAPSLDVKSIEFGAPKEGMLCELPSEGSAG